MSTSVTVHSSQDPHPADKVSATYFSGAGAFVSVDIADKVQIFLSPEQAIRWAEAILHEVTMAAPDPLAEVRRLYAIEVTDRGFDGSLTLFGLRLRRLAEVAR